MSEQPSLRHAFTARVDIGAPLVLGETGAGFRRVIPITGGSVEGPDLRGEVVPGGADWQTTRRDGVIEVEAIYTLKAADGALIHVVNRGIIAARDGEAPYVRTAPRFDAPDGPHAWMNRTTFVGTIRIANRERTAVEIGVWRVT